MLMRYVEVEKKPVLKQWSLQVHWDFCCFCMSYVLLKMSLNVNSIVNYKQLQSAAFITETITTAYDVLVWSISAEHFIQYYLLCGRRKKW